jgi:hypothetical protein
MATTMMSDGDEEAVAVWAMQRRRLRHERGKVAEEDIDESAATSMS